jgi:uncharacterized protein YeaO (DUF488 family)
MFMSSEFNGDISNWDVSNVKDFNRMFTRSKFSGDIRKWNISPAEIVAIVKQMRTEPHWFEEFKHKHRGELSGKKFGF